MNRRTAALAAAFASALFAATSGEAVAQNHLHSQILGNLLVTVSTVPFTRVAGDTAVALPYYHEPLLLTDRRIFGPANGGYTFIGFQQGGSGLYSGTAGPATAPTVIGGGALAESFLAAFGAPAVMSIGQGASNPDHLDLLWGSVSESDGINLFDGTNFNIVTGEQVLAIASAGGVSGTNGSYYVSFDIVPASAATRGFASVEFGWGSSAYNPTQEFGSIHLGAAARAPEADLSSIPPPVVTQPSGDSPVGAPSPVLGATPAGGVAGLFLLGLLGLTRRRAASTASAASPIR